MLVLADDRLSISAARRRQGTNRWGANMYIYSIAFGIVCLCVGAGLAALVLRRHLAASSQGTSRAQMLTATNPTSPEVAPGVSIAPVKLVLESDAGPFAEISRFSSLAHMGLEDITLDSRVSTGLQAVLQRAPTLAHDVASLAVNTYVVRFAPEIARGLSDGSLTMMQAVGGGLRASAVDATGKIAGNAMLLAPSAALTGALVVWQILAIVTAQKFLADINKRLAAIERGITDVKTWLTDEQHGKLEGNLRYMRQVADSLEKRDLTENDVNLFAEQLETIGREAQQVMSMQDLQITRSADALPRLTLSGEGLKEHSEAASRTLAEFAQVCQPWWLAAQIRGMAVQLRSHLPLSRDVALLRVRDLQANIRSQEVLQTTFIETAKKRIPELRGEWTFDSTDELHQLRIRTATMELDKSLIAATDELSEAARVVEQGLTALIEERTQPLELVVTVGDDGKPVRVQRMLSKATS